MIITLFAFEGPIDDAYHVLSEFCEFSGERIFLVFKNKYSSAEVFEDVRVEG